MRAPTHNERVLRLLSDGQPHTHHELYQLHVIAHSRVADLRKQGHRIVQWRDGDNYVYRLVDQGHEDYGAPVEAPPSPLPVAVPLIDQTEPFACLIDEDDPRTYGWEPS